MVKYQAEVVLFTITSAPNQLFNKMNEKIMRDILLNVTDGREGKRCS